METPQHISGNIVDLVNRSIYPGTLEIGGGKIVRIIKEQRTYDTFLIPGLVDAHIHIESSLLVPSEFARLAVTHGTVAVVADPHEIANVMGRPGIEFMIANSRMTPFKFHFGVPSCVPASGLEESGAVLDTAAVTQLFQTGQLRFLGEMMDIPAVLQREPRTMAKIKAARDHGYPVDGHAPGLTGADLASYIEAGITTDHETASYEEAVAKIKLGMKIQIREGSAARNFEALHPLIAAYPEACMFCSDDCHPDHLATGYIDELVRRALRSGYEPLDILQCASLNPIRHYQLQVGLLQPGDPADFAVINNFDEFKIIRTYLEGQLVAENGRSLLPAVPVQPVNNFHAQLKQPSDFAVPVSEDTEINVIGVIEGQLFTQWSRLKPTVTAGQASSDSTRDLIKLAVVNRYQDSAPAIGFIQNTGLQRGALAASVAHDSHNIIVMGITDADIAAAVNLIIARQGGLAAVNGPDQAVLPLTVAGIMSDHGGYAVAEQYTKMLELAKTLGCQLQDPYMTLGFMSLPVIPDLKLTSRGLVDVKNAKRTELFTK